MKKNNWKRYFKLISVLFIVVIGIWVAMQAYIFWLNKSIQEKTTIITTQNQELEQYKNMLGFTKLMAVKELEGKYEETPRSTHINKVITMLEEIKGLDQSNDGTLLLSDFNVNLQKISVKGQVSSLILLYYSNPERGIISLIDRFKNLDFVENMSIKNYSKEKDSNFFSFVLEANVMKDGK